MPMAAQVGVEKKGLREGAVVWLDQKLEGKSFSQRYDDARGLLKIASQSRSVLERRLGSVSPERADVKKTYSQYISAVNELIRDLEGAIKQMEKLRGEFAKSPHNSQLAAYDAQLETMKRRLAELKQDAKWCPPELRGYKPELASLRDETGKYNVQVASLDSRAKSVPVKVKAKMDTMEFTVAEVEEYEKKRMPLPKPKAEKKEPESEMVFTEKDVEHDQEIAQTRSEIKDLEAAIKKAKSEGKPLAKLRMERLDAYLKLRELTGEPVPKRVEITRA